MNKKELEDHVNMLKDEIFSLRKKLEQTQNVYVPDTEVDLPDTALGLVIRDNKYKMVTIKYNLDKGVARITNSEVANKNERNYHLARMKIQEDQFNLIIKNLKVLES